MNTKMLTASLALGAIIFGQALAQDQPRLNPTMDLVDTLTAAPDLTMLTKHVGETGLTSLLRETGPFTVFAPTDEAFRKLPQDILKRLADDKQAMKTVLQYHVVKGKTLAGDVRDGQMIRSAQGEVIKVVMKDSKWWFNNAGIVTADMLTSNGVIHSIDTVLIPPTLAKEWGIDSKKKN